MSIAEAQKKYLEAKKAAEDCQASILELQKKTDSLRESLPGLGREIENAERIKTSALDAFALSGDGKTADRLKRARMAYDEAIKWKSETQELLEACERAFGGQQAELIRLNEQALVTKRACWQAVADDLRSQIPAETIKAIQRLALVSSTQLGGSYDFCLKSLCPQPGHEEGLATLQGFRERYQTD